MPMSFVSNVYQLIFHLNYYALDIDTVNLCKSLESQIETKLDDLYKRNVFSKYKAAPYGSPEREVLRRQYLELAHVHKDWISSSESAP